MRGICQVSTQHERIMPTISTCDITRQYGKINYSYDLLYRPIASINYYDLGLQKIL